MKPEEKRLIRRLSSMEEEMVRFLRDIIAVPALSPESGGEGEEKKVEKILQLIDGWGFDSVERYDAPDERVPSGRRPNVLLRVRGRVGNLPPWWVFVHTDVVPPGDLSLWESDPWKLRREGEKLYGRGTEDNGQELVASLFGLRALLEEGMRPARDVNIFLVADEETGSEKGLKYLLREHKGLFGADDLYIVPDSGEPDGSLVEVAEKSILWVRVTTHGKQVHASTPGKGLNAHLAGMKYSVEVREVLKRRFAAEDPLYDEPLSTFEPTKKEANVDNVNTIPGMDVLYFDCRVLPQYRVGEVLAVFREVADAVGRKTGARIEVEPVQMQQAAPPTPPDSPVVGLIREAAEAVYGVRVRPGGIGGGTCAAILRDAGLPAAVWSRIDETAHMPNEYSLLPNLVGDAKVYSLLFLR